MAAARTSRTKPSTRRLSEAARHFVIPEGIVTTGWPKVEAKGKELGLGFDWWQAQLGRVILGKRADGKYAATIGGVTLSIPRQVGKTYFVGALIVILCVLFPGTKVIWTAHRTRTSTQTFRSLQRMVNRKAVRPHLKPNRSNGIRSSNGEQEIAFRNGSIIMFGAREQGFGRGFDEVDIEVFDEAQILTEKALEDMVAATNQARHPHGALLFYMGTPPRPIDPGEAFTLKRKKALKFKPKTEIFGIGGDGVYLEASADQDADPDDRKQWAKANFSYPMRTPVESMLRLRENLITDDAWLREAMGIWDEDSKAGILPNWPRCKTKAKRPPKAAAIGVAVSLDEEWASIAACGFWPDGKPNLGAVDRREGSDWIVKEAKRIQRKHGCPVVIDAKCPDKALIRALREAGVEVKVLTLEEHLEATSELRNRVKRRQVTHMDNADLDEAIGSAVWRYVNDRRLVGRKQSEGDVSMLEAAVMALAGALSEANYDAMDSVL